MLSFQVKSDKVLTLVRDKNFKSFSRDHVLKRLLKDLNNNVNEVHYLQHLEHLCNLENYYQQPTENFTKVTSDLIVALLNAWYLSKNTTSYQPRKAKRMTSTRRIKQSVDITNHENRRNGERKRIIDDLLPCVSNDEKYAHRLKKLCSIEGNLEEQDTTRCWLTNCKWK